MQRFSSHNASDELWNMVLQLQNGDFATFGLGSEEMTDTEESLRKESMQIVTEFQKKFFLPYLQIIEEHFEERPDLKLYRCAVVIRHA